MTEEEKELALDLLDSGFSFQQIANTLGVTRNKVAGMVYRFKRKVSVQDIVTKATRKVGGYTMEDINGNMCRYPTGHDGEQHLFCGKKTPSTTEPYCRAHRRVCYKKTEPHNPLIKHAH